MAKFVYQSGSPIEYVQIVTNESGGMRAYMHAADNASSEQLRNGKQEIRALGWKCVPIVHEGKPALEVRGFNTKEEYIKALETMGLTKDAPSLTPEEGDVQSKKDKRANSTLKLAGQSYIIGDAAYMWYAAGPTVRDWKIKSGEDRFFGVVGIVGGIGYALGSLCLSLFGSRDQSINTITAATTKIERFVKKEGYNVPADSSIAYANYQPPSGPLTKLLNVIAKYPSETFNSIYVGVGTCISATSIYFATKPINKALHAKELEKARFNRKWDRIDIGLGIVTATSAILGLAVKEQKKMEGEPKRTGIGGAIDWIREQPLRATGIGYMIATGFHTVATIGKWKHKDEKDKKFFIGRGIFIGTNIFSEIMLALSSKGHGVGVKPDSSVDESVISTAAELIMRQPMEKRESIISQLSGYIASPDVLAIKADHVEQGIRKHLDALEKNPWTKYFVASEPTSEPKPPQTNNLLVNPRTQINASAQTMGRISSHPHLLNEPLMATQR